MIWQRSHRADPVAVAIADRHYNRQKPGTPQFVPPGKCLVLKTQVAIWVSSWPIAAFVKHQWAGAWMNTMFRRESGPRASDMILEAVGITACEWGEPPSLGMISFVDANKVRHKRDPGRCYVKAGFRLIGETKGGLLAFQMEPGTIRALGIEIEPLYREIVAKQESLPFE